jgi:plastocyanin
MTSGGRSFRLLMSSAVLGVIAVAATAFSAPPASHRHEIEIRGMAFHPAELEAQAGDTIVWINRDIVPHTATRKAHWDTGTLEQGKSGRWIVKAGEGGEYACTLHPTMTGRITIKK